MKNDIETTISTLNYYADFFQIAYVTTNIQKSVDLFAKLYGISKFLIVDPPLEINLVVEGKNTTSLLKLGFANFGNHQIELIEPIEDRTKRFSEILPISGFGQRLHHLGCRFKELSEWKTFRTTLNTDQHPIAFENASGDSHYLYLNERPHLGHYLEYMWLDPQSAKMMENVPMN